MTATPPGPEPVDDAGRRGVRDDDAFEQSLSEELAGDVGTDDIPSAPTSPAAGTASASVLRSSMLMGAGTVASRFGGVLRGVALAAALGAGTVADAFTLGNTLPNVVYILIIGGALNAVFIPELVRHMKDDPDDGVGYADRLITLVSVALALLVVVAVVFAPFLVRIYATPQYTQQQLDLAIAFARFCLPQIFFYGAYTMLSQVLNARGHFGAPMFAPLVNNVVAIATFVLFIVVAGPEAGADGVLEPEQVTLLGVGTTLGVVAQALVLVPVLRRAGYRFRPRGGWRGAGLSVAGGLAAWTIGLVLVNQVAYAVIVRLATGVNAVSADAGDTPAGLTAYTNAHLMFVLPHSVITVSLVAALLPRMSRAAHDLRYRDLSADIAGGMRSASALIIPASVALVVLGTQAGILLFNYGQTSTQSAQVTGLLASVFALGLLPFTLYYIVLRGWYALERTSTAFWVTVVLNALNLAIAVPLYRLVSSNQTGPAALVALAAGYVAAYWLTLVVGWFVLSRQIGGLQTGATLRALAPMALAGLLTFGVMVACLWGINQVVPGAGKLDAVLRIVVVGGVGGAVYLGLARLLHIDEVTDVLTTLRRRLPIGR
ncbi:MAG: murein biosynthesis integral membrane protein MurJ [Candidatus Nanopelagicales bacterium]